MPEIYRYVLMSDGGMAPNPRGAMLSLATCKPVIRSVAKVGDWVIANRSAPHNSLIVWAGKISKTLSPDDYSAAFPEREDALYRAATDGLSEFPGCALGIIPSSISSIKICAETFCCSTGPVAGTSAATRNHFRMN